MAHNPNEKRDAMGVIHRTPIQEAETPQPRAPAVIDRNAEGLIDKLEDKLSGELHKAEDAAVRTAEKVKAKVSSIGSGSDTGKSRNMQGEGQPSAPSLASRIFGSRDKSSSSTSARTNHAENFDEGSRKAEGESTERFSSLAEKAKSKLIEAERVAEEWEKQSKDEIHDAWESARTHTQHIIKDYESRPTAHNLDEALTQIKKQNLMWQRQYASELCDRHPNRTQCYGAVKRLIALAKENARINMDMATRDVAAKD